MDINMKFTGCCPIFDPTLWDNKVFEWQDKKFVKGSVFTLFYRPLTFAPMVKKFSNIAQQGGTFLDNLMISDHASPWNMYVFVSVDKDIPGEEMVSITGKYFMKVYEGPYKQVKDWMLQFPIDAKVQGFDIEKTYAWYTTCPKCAKAYGKNYVVMVGKVAVDAKS